MTNDDITVTETRADQRPGRTLRIQPPPMGSDVDEQKVTIEGPRGSVLSWAWILTPDLVRFAEEIVRRYSTPLACAACGSPPDIKAWLEGKET